MPVTEERAAKAISEACRALRRRKAVEEGAHAFVFTALNRALTSEGSEFKEKVESLQQELSQCYKSQAHVSEQLVQEMQTAQALKDQLSEKDTVVEQLQTELDSARDRISQLEKELVSKDDVARLLHEELNLLRIRVKELESTLEQTMAENKDLVDRWMTHKMQEAERLNEYNAMVADLMARSKASSLADLARQQVDGVVRHSEEGAEHFVKRGSPTTIKHTLRAHERGCSALAFEHYSKTLVTSGHDNLVKLWDTDRGVSTSTLTGALGSVMDIALTADNKMVLGGCSDNKLYLWDVSTGRVKHVLTGHSDKVSSVDISKGSNRKAVSTAYDRTIKTWDLQTGYIVTTMLSASNCNALCLSIDGTFICSGHQDGALRFWDTRAGKQVRELTAHEPQAITSVSLSRTGSNVLTSGKDNVLKMFDVRSLEQKSTFRAQGYTVSTNFSRSCMSGDESYVAAGSGNGSVFIWNRSSSEVETVLKGGHESGVVSSVWSQASRLLASADKSGTVCLWN